MSVDIPVISMVVRSGWVARIILLLLLFLSILSWAIIFNRLVSLTKTRKLHGLFRSKMGGLDRVVELETIDPKLTACPMGRLAGVAVGEYKRILTDSHTHSQVRDWSFFLSNQFAMASERMESEITASVARLDSGLFVLAIISSVAPFLGLLGTVWGIMNSFFEIGNQGSASLPVVAPGIAEALITTIVGLAVAIPAVFFYNVLVHQVQRVEDQLDESREQLQLRLRRDIFKLLYGSATGAQKVVE